jgi:hypothetical protein
VRQLRPSTCVVYPRPVSVTLSIRTYMRADRGSGGVHNFLCYCTCTFQLQDGKARPCEYIYSTSVLVLRSNKVRYRGRFRNHKHPALQTVLLQVFRVPGFRPCPIDLSSPRWEAPGSTSSHRLPSTYRFVQRSTRASTRRSSLTIVHQTSRAPVLGSRKLWNWPVTDFRPVGAGHCEYGRIESANPRFVSSTKYSNYWTSPTPFTSRNLRRALHIRSSRTNQGSKGIRS